MQAIAFIIFLIPNPSISPTVEESALSEAVRRGVAYVEKEGVDWIKKRDCVSCHQVPAMLWTLGEAHKRGFYDHPKKLAKWTEWSIQWEHWNNPMPDQTEAKVAAGNVDTMTSLILANPINHSEKAKEAVARYIDHIVRLQQKDGSWKSGGQLPLQKRAKEESNEVTTMWTILALDSSGMENEKISKARRQAVKYLDKLSPGKSTEWWVVRWLIERTRDKKKADGMLAQLLKFQHKDGGWGWLHDDPSDAFGTGLALYSLSQSGLGKDHEAIQRAQEYLLRTQHQDGSWPTKSTLARHKMRIIPTSQHWATAWATLGLLSTMDK